MSLRMGTWLTPQKHAAPSRVSITNLVTLGQTVSMYVGGEGHKRFGDAGAPYPWDGRRLTM